MTAPAAAPARTRIAGEASGELLRLDAPISFWGGVDPVTGRVQNVRHPQCGAVMGGRVVAIPRLIGSSSASAILLELIHAGRAPAALILGGVDAVLLIGALVAREIDLPPPPAVELAPDAIAMLPAGEVRISAHPDGAAEIRPAAESAEAGSD